jgi:hypothetical protein
MAAKPPSALLTLRATVVLSLALIAGILSGVLSYLAGDSLPAAVLWGGGAAGGAVVLLHRIVGLETDER